MQHIKTLLFISSLLLLKISLTAMPSVYVCANDLVNLEGFVKKNVKGTAFCWHNSNTKIGLAAMGGGGIPVFTAINATTDTLVSFISYTTTNSDGSAQTLDFTLTVRPKPILMLSSLNTTLCNGTTFNQTLTSLPKGAAFNFTTDNVTIGLLTSTTSRGLKFVALNTKGEVQNAHISITPVLNGCMGSSQFIQMVVLPTPVVYQPSDLLVCSSEAVSVLFSGLLTGTTFHWTNDNPSVGLPSAGSGNLNFRTAANITGVNQVANIVVTPYLNGCEGQPKSFKISVKPAPILSTTTFNFCVNDSVHIELKTNLLAATTETFIWANDNTKTGIPLNGSSKVLDFIAQSNLPTTVMTAHLTVSTIADGCSAWTQVAVNIKPRPNLFNPGNLFIATGQSVAIHFISDIEGTTFDWTNSLAAIGLPLSGSGDLRFMTAMNLTKSALTANIVATPSLNGCTEQAQTFTITLPPTPSVSTPFAKIPNKTNGSGAN
jgi:hypothetical protein